MKITVLSDAKAMDGFESEHGLSFLIEAEGKQLLFDTGASLAFRRNALILGIDLEEVDQVVLSHGHWDHGNGLPYLRNLPLLCHPGCFRKRFHSGGKENLGLNLEREDIQERFELRVSEEPVQITERLWFLGEIPRLNDFEALDTRYRLEDGSEDFITDDSGLACMTDEGLVLVSGCAHAGICNMLDHAIRLTGCNRVAAIIGGFHLQQIDEKTRRTIEYLEAFRLKHLYPSHCTRLPALKLFQEALGAEQVLAGSTIVLS